MYCCTSFPSTCRSTLRESLSWVSFLTSSSWSTRTYNTHTIKKELLIIIVRCPRVYAVFNFFLEMDWVWSDSTSVLCVMAWIMQNRALCCVVLGCCIKTSLMGVEGSMGSRPSYLKKKFQHLFLLLSTVAQILQVSFLWLRSGMSERISVLSMQNQKNL